MKKLLAALLSMMLLTACSATPSTGAELAALMGAVNLARQSIPAWTEGEKAAVFPPADFASTITDAEAELLLTPRDAADAVDAADTAADVDLFFRALRSAYGAYFYYGGDEVFLPIRDALLQELADKPPITGASLGRLLRRHLAPVLRDERFTIDGVALTQEARAMYYVPELYFDPKDVDAADFVRPTIAPDGRLAYCFAALSADGGDLPATATVAGAEKALRWVRAEPAQTPPGAGYAATTTQGVPTLRCGSLAQSADGAQALLDDAASWRDRPYFILDLRGCADGTEETAAAWFRAFADSDAPTKEIRLVNCSRLLLDYDLAQEGGDRVAVGAGTWTSSIGEGGQVLSESLIFVLQDEGVALAGESFLKMLSSLENVVFVGSGSKGGGGMSRPFSITLPKTGVSVGLCGGLNLFRTTEDAGGAGLLPDLWVPPDEADARVAKLIRFYALA